MIVTPSRAIVRPSIDDVRRFAPPFGKGLPFWGPIKNPSGSVFDPATLALTGWWRGSFAGSPWVGTASAGTSANQDMTEATNPPSVGATLNGYATADFDGTNDRFVLDDVASTYVTAAAFSGWCLVYADVISTNNATVYENDGPIAQVGGYWGISFKSAGEALFYMYDGAIQTTPAATFAAGAWQLVQWKYDGTNIKIRVNSGAWQSTAAGNLGSTAEALRAGGNYSLVQFLDGRIADMALSKVAFSDGTFDDIKSYANGRYGLAL